VGTQLGQALSAYHTHQASAAPAPQPAAGASSLRNTSGDAQTYTPAQTGYQTLGANGSIYSAVWDPDQQQYVLRNMGGPIVGPDFNTSNLGSVGTFQMPTSSGSLAGSSGSVQPTFLVDGRQVTLGELNNQAGVYSQAAAQNQAQAQGIQQDHEQMGASMAAEAAAAQAQAAGAVTPAATVNNNQDFINAISAQMGNINTAPGVVAADATSANTQNALSSQLSTSAYQSGDIGAAARYGAGAAVQAEGAGTLAHEAAAGQAFDADLGQLSQAATQQLQLADNETQAQATTQVQGIADELTNLQSQLGHLDANTQLQVTNNIAALQNQIQQYQNSIQAYGASSSDAMSIFKSILSGVAQVASIAGAVA
jgi:hypothetical protein